MRWVHRSGRSPIWPILDLGDMDLADPRSAGYGYIARADLTYQGCKGAILSVRVPRSRYMVPRSWHKLRSFKGQFMNQAARKQDRERGSREHRICTWLNSFGDLPSKTQAILYSGRELHWPTDAREPLKSLKIADTWIAWPGCAVTTRLKTRSRQEEAASNWKGHNTPQGQPPAAIKWSQARSAAEPIAVRRISVRPSPPRSRVPSIRSLYSAPTHLRETSEERNRPTDGYTR
jgi:hypothetical protein